MAKTQKKTAKTIDKRKKLCYNRLSITKPEVFVGVARAYMGVTRTCVTEQGGWAELQKQTENYLSLKYSKREVLNMKKNPKSFLSKALAVALTVLMLVAASVLVVSATDTEDATVVKVSTAKELQTALDAGATSVKFAADISGDVTIKKNVTLDGADFKYTGKMTVDTDKLNIVISNVNFLYGSIYAGSNTSKTSTNITVSGCGFVGNDDIGYGITVKKINKLKVENCTAEDYYYGFIYVPASNNAAVEVTGGTVQNVTAAFNVSYGAIHLDGVTIKNATYGIYTQNHGAKTITVKNSTFEAVVNPAYTYKVSGKTNVNTFSFSGVNNLGTDKDMVTDYTQIVAEAQNGTKIGSLKAIAADAKSGDTVTLLKDYTGENVQLPVGVKLNKNGFTGNIEITPVTLPEVVITDIKKDLTGEDPDLTFALNFAIKDLGNLTDEYLEALFLEYGDWYTDYVLTISGLNAPSVKFNANGNANGYLAGQYDNWSEYWVTVPFDDVEIENGQSLYIMEYAAELLGKNGLRFTLAEIAEIVQNFNCGVYFTPEFLAANPDLKVELSLVVFQEDEEKNKTYAPGFGLEENDSVTNTFNVENIVAVLSGTNKQSQYFTTFNEAYNAAQAGDTIVLLKDVTLNGKLTVNKNITIDGNGHKIIANHTAFILETASDCTFKNITLDTNNKAKGVKIASGNVVFDSVIIPNSNKSDAITVAGTLTIKNYFKVESSYQVFDARSGAVDVEEGTVFDFTSRIGLVSPATSNLDAAVDAEGNPFFAAKGSTTYYTNLNVTTVTNLTLFKDVALNSNITLSGTLDLNGHSLSLAEGKTIKASGNLTVINGTVSGEFVLTSTTQTLTGPEGLNVTTTVANYKVVYENGTYKVVLAAVAKIGDEYYATLAEAMAEANKAAGDYTITLLGDNAEVFAFAQNSGVNITIDGSGYTFTGKITLNAGAGNLTITNATLTPSNADAKTIVLNAATAPNITIVGCTMKNTGTSGAIVWGQASITTTKVVIKNSTASNLQYLVGTNQTGAETIVVENVTATNMAYLIRPMKATKVTVKDVTYTGLTFIEVTVSNDCMLTLENVNVNTTQLPSVLMNAPDSASFVPTPYKFYLKGDQNVFKYNGTVCADNSWILVADAARCPYEFVVAQVGDKYYTSLQNAIDAANGATITLLKNINEDVTIAGNVVITGATNSGKFTLVDASATLTIDTTANVVSGVENYEVATQNGAYVLVETIKVAELNGVAYKTLAEAIAAATAGDTITFLADITENVTIDKAITIDGNGKTYTGTMSIVNGKTVTIQEVNFVKGCIDKAKGSSGKLTVKDCNFDGVDKSINYAVTMRGGSAITVENCTVINYGFGFLYVPSAVTNVNVSKTTVTGGSYGVHVAYGTNVSLENVTMSDVKNGVYTQNYGAKIITIKNCSITGTNPIGVWVRNETTVDTFVFEGENYIPALANKAQAIYKLAEGATLTAPEGLTVTTDLAGYTVKYEGGKYVVKANMVAIGEETYASLAEAITAAQAGQTITFLADITENVTIDKAITIDGNGKTFTGQMVLKKNITVKNVNFDGQGYDGYAVVTKSAYIVVIEDCTVKNYAYGFLNINSNNDKTTVKNVTVSDVNYGIKIDRSNGVTLENVDITAGTAAIYNSNYGVKTIAIKNSKLNIIRTWTRNETVKTTYVFEGENTVGEFKTNATIDNFKLAANATLTAPAGLNVTTNASGYVVKYIEGVYKLVEAVAEVNGVAYDSLQAAIQAAQTGETVTLLKDLELGNDNFVMVGSYKVMFSVEGKDITLDMNGKSITVVYTGPKYLIAVIRVADGAGLTVTGNGKIDVAVQDKNVAYTFWKAGTTGHLTILDGYYHMNDAEDSMIYTNGNGIVTIYGGTFIIDAVGTAANGFPCIFNAQGQNEKHVVVKGGSFNADINHQYYCFEVEVPENLALKKENGLWTVVPAKAYAIEEVGKYTHKVGYATFEEALAAPNAITVVLLENTTYSGVVADVALDLNGFTFTGTVLNTVMVNGGLWITADGFKMIGVNADYYSSSDAVVNVTATELTIVSGTVTLAQSWRTLVGQNIVVDVAATFVVPADMTFTIYENTSVVVNGNLTVEGTVILNKGATLTAPEGLNVQTNLAGYIVNYSNDGKYQAVTNFVAEYENMRFGNTLSLLYAIPQYAELGEGCYVEFVHRLPNGDVKTFLEGTELKEMKKKVYFSDWDPQMLSGYYVVEYTDLAAKEMTELVDVTFYDAQGNALGKTFTSSIQDYADRVLDSNDLSDFHKVVIAMLNYGTAAQKYFDNYNGDKLANSILSGDQLLLTEFAGVADPRNVEGAPEDVVLFTASGVRFNDSINLVFQFKGISEEAAKGLTVTFAANGETIEVDELAWDKESGAWTVELDALNIKDAYVEVTCTIERNGKTLTITDSVAGYITRRLAAVEENSAAANLYNAFMNFAIAAGAKPAPATQK